jgi:hypothetical protein
LNAQEVAKHGEFSIKARYHKKEGDRNETNGN